MPKNYLTAAQAYEISSGILDTVMKDIINSVIGAAEKGETSIILFGIAGKAIISMCTNLADALAALGYQVEKEPNYGLRISWEKGGPSG